MSNDENEQSESIKFNRNFYTNEPVAGFADLEPVKDDEGRIIRYKTIIKAPSFPDGSDAYANNFDTFISIASAAGTGGVIFKAFITAFNETYTPNFNPTEVFGRTDPIYQYKNTSRNITVAWKIPAASEGEAYENLGKVQKLITMLYPSYSSTDSSALTLSKAPIVKLQVMNLLSDTSNETPPGTQNPSDLFQGYSVSATSKGLLGVITSCNVNHNLEGTDGVFQKPGSKGTILPKLIDVNISFQPLHQETLKNISQGFPYNVTLSANDKENNFEDAPNGFTLSQQREAKLELEKKRRDAAKAQQDLDRKAARALRAYDKAMQYDGDNPNRQKSLNERQGNLRAAAAGAGQSQQFYDALSAREAAEDFEQQTNIDAILGY